MEHKYNLSRFTAAHDRDFSTALREIKSGRKISHWMWYIFPQIRGLGRSSTSQYYSIQNLDEAIAFLNDPYLGGNFQEICQALLALETNNATEVFGKPDDIKLKSSMTLFAMASEENSIFHQVLEKFFKGKYDELTLRILSLC